MRRLVIKDLSRIGPACIPARTETERTKAIIDLAEPASMDGVALDPMIMAPADDPKAIAVTLLAYGDAIIISGMDLAPNGRPVSARR